MQIKRFTSTPVHCNTLWQGQMVQTVEENVQCNFKSSVAMADEQLTLLGQS